MKPFAQQTYYEILEVPVTAPMEDIHAAYKRLMELYAPDSIAVYALVDPDQVDALRARMTEAMEILTEPDLRVEYDKDLGLPALRLVEAATPAPSAVERAAESLSTAVAEKRDGAVTAETKGAPTEPPVAVEEEKPEKRRRSAEDAGEASNGVTSTGVQDFRASFFTGFSLGYVTSSFQMSPAMGSAVDVSAAMSRAESASSEAPVANASATEGGAVDARSRGGTHGEAATSSAGVEPRAVSAPTAVANGLQDAGSTPLPGDAAGQGSGEGTVAAEARSRAVSPAPQAHALSVPPSATTTVAEVASEAHALAASPSATTMGAEVVASEAQAMPASPSAPMPAPEAVVSHPQASASTPVAVPPAQVHASPAQPVASTGVMASAQVEASVVAAPASQAAATNTAPAVVASAPVTAQVEVSPAPQPVATTPVVAPPVSQIASQVADAPPVVTQTPASSELALASRPASRPSPGGRRLGDAQVLSQDAAIATAEAAMAQVAARVREVRPRIPDIPSDAEFNGELLRRVREARGYTLQQVADRTRISSRHLENVEADRYTALPAQVYLRGILMNLARELGLDPLRVSRSYLALAFEKSGKK
ncbi:helix-turn-helix domain-containing protein [Myxococcus sp. K15C18031901]|uniref:helix-turn-helix domain-containing protein n=1 Tax=Myxococcus dinghuensis TaxID=2906761 RepID=UPI0020A7EFCA|nr:helix-turn-helix domain-containing protein [Myxococcus dinghuensis]MCP3101610.1 helix-turn-helix domain-containing protein [Myxococcus dinghuensis]